MEYIKEEIDMKKVRQYHYDCVIGILENDARFKQNIELWKYIAFLHFGDYNNKACDIDEIIEKCKDYKNINSEKIEKAILMLNEMCFFGYAL